MINAYVITRSFFIVSISTILLGCSAPNRQIDEAIRLDARQDNARITDHDQSVCRILSDLCTPDKERIEGAMISATRHMPDQRIRRALLAYFILYAPGLQPEHWEVQEMLKPMRAQGLVVKIRKDMSEYHIYMPDTDAVYVVTMLDIRNFTIKSSRNIDKP